MSVLYIVVPLALLVVGAAVWAYLWAARDGQFDDLGTPAVRVLHEEPEGDRDPPAGRGGPDETPSCPTPGRRRR